MALLDLSSGGTIKHMFTCKEMASSALASGAPTARLVRSHMTGRLEASRTRMSPSAALCLQQLSSVTLQHNCTSATNKHQVPGSCGKYQASLEHRS
jgi:hypothetical protein